MPFITPSSGVGSGLPILFQSTLGGSAASFDFTPIPATSSHLLIVVNARGDTAATTTGARLRVNNDSGTNYASQFLSGLAGVAAAGEEIAGTPTSAILGNITAANAPASSASPIFAVLLNYNATTFFKSLVLLSGDRRGAAGGGVGMFGGTIQWLNAAAVTRLTIFPAAGSLIAGSSATVYGLV